MAFSSYANTFLVTAWITTGSSKPLQLKRRYRWSPPSDEHWREMIDNECVAELETIPRLHRRRQPDQQLAARG